MLKKSIIALPVVFALSIGEVPAASVTPIVGYIGTYSSNILRTSTSEEQEYINRPLLGVDIDHRGRKFNAYGYATAEHFDFTRGTAENETYFDVSGIANWNIIGNRFVWVLEDYASVTPLIISDPITPLNVEQRNIFATGPTFSTRLGSRNLIDWNLRYGDFYYQLSDISNKRVYSDIGLSRQINPTNNIRLGYEYTRTKFEEEYYPDYIRQDLGLTFTNRSASGEMTATAGYTNTYVDQEYVIDQLDGWFASLVASRRVGRRTLLNLITSSGLSDSGLDNLSRGVAEVIPDVSVTPSQAFSAPPQAPIADPYRSTVLSVGLTNRQSLLVSNLDLAYHQANYASDNINDNRRIDTNLDFEYLVKADSNLGLSIRFGKIEYPNLDVETVKDEEAEIGINFTKRLFRRVNLRFGGTRYIRSSNQPDRGYQETVAEIQIIYRPSGRRFVARRVRGR